MAFDVTAIRRDFPILVPRGLWQAAGLSRQCRLCPEAEAGARRDHEELHGKNMQTCIAGCTSSPTPPPRPSRMPAKAYGAFLNAPSKDQIIFTRNATEAINLVAQSFGGMVIGEGDEIVLSILEHHSNIVPWHFHRERNGAVLKWAPIDDDGNFLLDEFEKLLTPRTKIVAITQMSNALGTIVPMAEVIRLAHARGIPVLVDGSQAAVHMPVDVQALDADFYVFTGHKTYGPTGIGVLYGKADLLQVDAALSGWRRDDQRGDDGRRDLQRAAAPLRGRNACHRAGHRSWRGTRLHARRGPRQHCRPRGRHSATTPWRGCRRSTRCASSAAPGTRAPSCPSPWRGLMPMTSPP